MMHSRLVPLLVVVAALSSPSALSGAKSPTWGPLEPGTYAVGVKVIEARDASRPFYFSTDLDGRPRSGDRSRPMQITIWYPAAPTHREPIAFGYYVDLMPKERTLTAPAAGARTQNLFSYPIFDKLHKSQIQQLRDTATGAVLDAAPAPGRFPVILWSLGSPALSQGLTEYLASHGYVVATAPRLGPWAGSTDVGNSGLDFQTKLDDMRFVLNEVAKLPTADIHTLGTTGFSAGGPWALSLALTNPDVRAVASLDSVMFWPNRSFQSMYFYAPEDLRVPILHLVRSAYARQEDPKLLDTFRYSNRRVVEFTEPKLDHLDFVSAGWVASLVGARAELKLLIESTMSTIGRSLLDFFDAELKHSDLAAQNLDRLKPSVDAINPILVRSLPAQPAPPREAELLNSLNDAGVDGLITLFRRKWKEQGVVPISEATINSLAYQLMLGSGDIDDAIRLLELNVEAHPGSANVYDSLGDAWLQKGDRDMAAKMARKTIEALATDDIPEERKAAIRKSAEAKLQAQR